MCPHRVVPLAFLLVLLPTFGFSWTVPSTGITKCYNNSVEISCPAKGEAFYGQNGTYPGTAHTFVTDADTATDQITGLVWQRTADGQLRNWTDAAAYCDVLTLGGQTDWRLPHQRELVTLVDHAAVKPAWSTDLSGTSGHYWSDTPYVGYAGPYWYVNFAYGVSEYNAATEGRYVRCVRGQALAGSVFVDKGTTVRDTTTGLDWEKAASAASMSWQDALAYCQSRTTGGHADWRTPNVMELRSLVDYARISPAVNPTLFPDSQQAFWTGSTTADLADLAWRVDLAAGTSANEMKTNTGAFVRCVRDAAAPPFVVAPLLGLLFQ
jgi:hypothetical protein